MQWWEHILAELRARAQWVCWKLEVRAGEAKPTKVPYNPRTGGKARSDRPGTWSTLQHALGALAADPSYTGIGFMFAADDPYLGVDLDNCLEEDGTLKSWALPLVAMFPGGYVEVTPSGHGLHIITLGSLPEDSRHKVPCGDGHVEAYDRLRFFTMTGKVSGAPVAQIAGGSDAVAELVETVLGRKTPEKPSTPGTAPRPVTLDDQALLDRMFGSEKGWEYRALWQGDLSSVPRKANGDPDYSIADARLCEGLAWWTDRDRGRIDRLFRRSALYREKWDEQHGAQTYGAMTINLALQGKSEGYQGPRPRAPPRVDEEAPPIGDTAEAVHELTRKENALRRKAEELKDGQAHPVPFSAESLMEEELPEPRWAVPGILSEGANMLAGRPKLGKSWLCLNLALAIASGGKALGSIHVEAGEVLYMALEDTKRRLKRRLKTILRGEPVPRGLYLVTSWPRAGEEQGEIILDNYLTERPEVRLVIIDTLARMRGARGKDGVIYEDDYKAIQILKAIADKHQVCILIVHHVRKSASEDPLEMVSGSHGITGALDTIIVLSRDRCDLDGTLFVTGRDVDEERYALHFDSTICSWSLIGTEEERLKSREREEILRVLAMAPEPMTPAQVAKVLEKSRASMKQSMWRMASDGEILSIGEGKYCRRQAN